jgi:hypothetical protein
MKNSIAGLLALLWTVLISCTSKAPQQDALPILIEVWYGDHQQFGTPGLAQRWINVLGNVQCNNGLLRLCYYLNDGEAIELTIGSDLHRLASDGDFNIDIPVDSCRNDINQIRIVAEDSSGFELLKKVEVVVRKHNRWPLPYSIRWSELENIQEAVQVVDGLWEITDNGLHNIDTYYDRVVAFGDTSWQDYEVSTTIIFHDSSDPQKGPPTYNVVHAAIASRWPGHDVDNLQPHRKWYPLGATSEFRLTDDMDSCRWRIFDGPKPDSISFYIEQPVEAYRSIILGKKYGMKHRVESLGDQQTRYSVKLWPYDQPEPESWDFQGIESGENVSSGSALLIAHHTNVTFGDVVVNPLDN